MINNKIEIRQTICKKAASIVAFATIAGAGVTAQPAKESEAFIGAIIGTVVTVASVAASVASGVDSSNKADAEARLQAEEEAKILREQEEQARIEAALEQSSSNIRVQQELDAESGGKVIDVTITGGNQPEEEEKNNKGNDPYIPPTDVNVGGFDVVEDGDSSNDSEIEGVEEEIEKEDQVEDEELLVEDNQEVQEDNQVNISESNNDNLPRTRTFAVSHDEQNYDEINITKEEVYVHEGGMVGEYSVDIGGDNFIDEEEHGDLKFYTREEAENHEMVEQGIFHPDEIQALDKTIRTGALTNEIIVDMYEQELIPYEDAQNILDLMKIIYEDMKIKGEI